MPVHYTEPKGHLCLQNEPVKAEADRQAALAPQLVRKELSPTGWHQQGPGTLSFTWPGPQLAGATEGAAACRCCLLEDLRAQSTRQLFLISVFGRCSGLVSGCGCNTKQNPFEMRIVFLLLRVEIFGAFVKHVCWALMPSAVGRSLCLHAQRISFINNLILGQS